ELLEALGSTDPATLLWTFHPPDQTAGFWRRRMAQETVVHRVDAESAHGRPRPVPAALAADGVDEGLAGVLAPPLDGRPGGRRGAGAAAGAPRPGRRRAGAAAPPRVRGRPGQGPGRRHRRRPRRRPA